jgi:hypothetical protein
MPTNNLISNYVTRRDEQHFFINGNEVAGLQNLDIEYSPAIAPLKHIGCGGQYFTLPSSRFGGQASATALLISNDPFIALTGNSGVNGYIVKTYNNTSQNFSFVSGYLSSYTINCSVGQIPQINASFDIFGEIGKVDSSDAARISSDFAAIASYTPNMPLRIASSNSISLNISDFNTNRVQSFNLGINCARNPIYILGNRYPSRVENEYPIAITLDFAMDLNDYNAKKASLFPLRDTKSNVTIGFNDIQNGQSILNFSFPNMTFAGEAQRANVNSSVSVVTKYIAYYGR